ncbi:unnamed protein product [Effrenium voratum]|uniref:Uncharacterized protein n=1 Tax=Effrenium voratum TaxID=2562239 RepID=A0AA36NK53_9DINO|nr:unnamed protein product [Effrenium voratum]
MPEEARRSSQTNGPGSTDVTRDNFIPLFDGKPASYKEYRKRIMLYYLKMSINNKKEGGRHQPSDQPQRSCLVPSRTHGRRGRCEG